MYETNTSGVGVQQLEWVSEGKLKHMYSCYGSNVSCFSSLSHIASCGLINSNSQYFLCFLFCFEDPSRNFENT